MDVGNLDNDLISEYLRQLLIFDPDMLYNEAFWLDHYSVNQESRKDKQYPGEEATYATNLQPLVSV